MITIYTDGSSRGNPGPGGWAAIILKDDLVAEVGGREGHTTNNRMELMAVISALQFLTSYSLSDTTIYTDSEYVMKGITQWVKNWQLKNWKTKAKKPVLNQDLWQELLKLTEGQDITWKYVAGHSGVLLNERADEIATSFADNLVPDLYNGPKGQYRYA